MLKNCCNSTPYIIYVELQSEASSYKGFYRFDPKNII
nr:MAG TPA: hypothetical protein [Caudoviricetes sp.]